jgi:amidophosphoribosyltransferase
VVPVPDSGVPAAIGYSQHPACRSSSASSATTMSAAPSSSRPSVRELGVRMKHNANRAAIEGKRIVLIDDSLVRGTTSKKIVQMMRDAGAKRSAFPHRLAADHASRLYGIDTPEREKLPPRDTTSKEMREIIGAIRWRSCRSTACTAPWASPAAIRRSRPRRMSKD